MINVNYDLRFLDAGIEELETYLLSKEIYWPLGIRAPNGFPPYPRFTLGWLVFVLERCNGYLMAPGEERLFISLQQKTNSIRERWKSAWELKASTEINARLTLWKNYLSDYRKNNKEHVSRYSYEVQRRVMIQLLARDTQIDTDTKTLLLTLDRVVKGAFEPGEFIWDSQYSASFSRDKFWYLYGRLKD